MLGKGNKWRDVPFPVWLAKAIQGHIASERKDAIEKRKTTDPSFVDHGRVFVQADNEKGTPGDPIKPKQINRIFQTARSVAAGAGTTCAAKSARFRTYTFHGLRHTFALATYAARRAAGDHNPGRYVQVVLGHARQETTDRLYLQASLLHEAELSDYVQGFLLEMAVMHA